MMSLRKGRGFMERYKKNHKFNLTEDGDNQNSQGQNIQPTHTSLSGATIDIQCLILSTLLTLLSIAERLYDPADSILIVFVPQSLDSHHSAPLFSFLSYIMAISLHHLLSILPCS